MQLQTQFTRAVLSSNGGVRCYFLELVIVEAGTGVGVLNTMNQSGDSEAGTAYLCVVCVVREK